MNSDNLKQQRRSDIIFHFLQNIIDFRNKFISQVNSDSADDFDKKINVFLNETMPFISSEIISPGRISPDIDENEIYKNSRISFYRVKIALKWITSFIPISIKHKLVKIHGFDKLRSEINAPLDTISLLNNLEIGLLSNKISEKISTELDIADKYAASMSNDVRELDVFISQFFMTTWEPFSKALKDKGRHVAWLGTYDLKEFSGYGALKTSEISADTKYIGNIISILYLICNLKKGNILLNCESFGASHWNYESTSMLYMIQCAIEKTYIDNKIENSQLILFMYDGVKPVSDRANGGKDINPNKSAMMELYYELINSCDKIIFNSNAENFGDFLENSLSFQKPRLHLNRYTRSVAPFKTLEIHEEINTEEIHVACITTMLLEFHEPSRHGAENIVRRIIDGKLYFHYFCQENDSAVKKFQSSLEEEQKKFFIVHPLESDQEELLKKLRDFDFGITMSDHQAFAKGVNLLDDRVWKDILPLFWQSTIGTSSILYAAAGLPVILQRGCLGANAVLGEAAVIPLTFAEFNSIGSILRKPEIRAKKKQLRASGRSYAMKDHVHRYIKFVKSS